ncbi:Anhydro-N-acetylmuramic acid kinase [Sinobacterium norvegicum]|uniref:Anhydro-N-acetylmuramic acid kinase n=1 Tax=Sinobacterium norvegicum TaxID=1641715 RepID=A0ABN8EMB0_9GAMM|nr:anhydro-N-acetylmuramic acid kinase [Sinobacterium norvegicum]CAH0992798.1 Anhydro-N-acetylmuramic acid kinase [Sinobacterium norvegicum]
MRTTPVADLYIGLMSGTSLDCIDAVIIQIDQGCIKLLNSISHPLDAPLRRNIEQLMQPGDNEIELMGRVDRSFSYCQAAAIKKLLIESEIDSSDICAIGSHGQTIRHRPNSQTTLRQHAFTLQIGCPSTLAFETGITTVADFRRKDIAAGGQGAPLAPMFHRRMLGTNGDGAAICNIGGISNPTIITDKTILGFDSGPGNTLMDAWIEQCLGHRYDQNGDWANTGIVIDQLLKQMLAEDYFQQSAPKSTGRELFNRPWLQSQLDLCAKNYRPEDVQRTLLELTAQSISDSLKPYKKKIKSLYLCGGGAHNTLLKQRLTEINPIFHVATTAELGIDPDWVEACAFGWLAHQTINHRTANACSITGASRETILGGIYYS